MTGTYRDALRQAQADLANAIQQRDDWTLEIARLQQLVKSLAAMVEHKPQSVTERPDEVGLQEVVQTCVRASRIPLSATDVKHQLETVSFDLGRYSNPLAVIHGALKRLAKDGRIQATEDGKYYVSSLWETLLGTTNAPIRTETLRNAARRK